MNKQDKIKLYEKYVEFLNSNLTPKWRIGLQDTINDLKRKEPKYKYVCIKYTGKLPNLDQKDIEKHPNHKGIELEIFINNKPLKDDINYIKWCNTASTAI